MVFLNPKQSPRILYLSIILESLKNTLIGVPKSWSIGRVLRSFNSSIAETLGLNLSGKDLKIL